ncbi:putative uncharacterized protein [Lachnospiraceae bacterium CAG:364]|nr:putative uncharacterized protein [Lachnospiraceae bacterium CAG:364]
MQTENHYTETDLGNVSPNPRGDYNNTVKYEYLDLVTMQGGSYLCVIPVGQTITGTAPEPGKTTEHWQCLTMPGDMTPQYTEAHDKVVRLAKEVAQNTTKVAEDKQSVAQMETDVRQLKEQTAESARQAENSKDSAVGSARAAKTAEDNIRQVANNVNTLVNGFDTHVAEKTTEATQAVATAKDNAVQAVERQETASVQEVKDQTGAYITEQKNLAKQELDNKVDQFGLDVNAIKAEVSEEGQKQITNVQEATTAELAKITEKGTEQAGIVTTEGEKQVQAVQTAAQEIIADREQIQKNKADIADLWQNKADAIVETASGTLLNVKDSSGAFFEDFSMSGKTTQDGTPTPDTPVPIVNAGESGNIEVKVVGKNILDVETATPKGWNLDITNLSNFEAGRTYTMTVVSLNDGSCGLFLDDHNELVTYLNPGQSTSFVMPDKSTFKKMSLCGGTATALLKDRSKVKVQIQLGNKSTAYEPYKEPQTLTLQLAHPLTKWDKLEKREGVWGIVRKSEIKILDGTENWHEYTSYKNEMLHCYFVESIKAESGFKKSFCTHFINTDSAWLNEIGKYGTYSDHKTLPNKYFVLDKPTVEDFKAWLVQQKEAGTPVELVYKTAEEIWEPLPEEMQSVLNALHTNYPTTVVTNSEDTEMQLTYIADTKNYHLGREKILQKQILEIQNALISQKISGGGIKVTNSAKLPIAKLSVFGKSEQITTTGANLFNALTITEKHWLNTENGNIEPASTFWTSDFIEVEEGDYCLTEKGTNRNCGYDEGKNFVKKLLASKGKITVTSGIKFIRVSGVYETIKPNNLMINRGPTTKPYEPYTGGKPSPSTEYPQEITSCGDKGTIEIKVTGKNLIPFPYPAISGNKGTKNGITWEVLTDGGIRLQGTASTAFYLDLDNNLKIGNTLIAPGNTDGKIAANKDVTYNGDIAKVYIAVAKGMTVNRVYYPQIEYGTISTSYEPYREPQELTLPTQNGLPGLKVDGNGNYTDETGQQWIADEIDLARGKYVQRIARRMFDGNEQLGDNLGGKTSLRLRVDNIRPETGLCNYGKIVKANTIEQEELSFSVSSSGIYLCTTKTAVEFKNLLKQKYDSGKPVEVLYALKTPIETDLPPETISAFKKLHTNYPTTIVSNNAEAGMELTYTVDTQSYVDSKIAEINMQVVNTQKQLLQERSK